MRLIALSVATAALVAFAIPQIPRVQAQGSNTQSGANASQSTTGQSTTGQSRRSDGASTRGSNSRGASVGERSENAGRSAGVRSGKSQSSVGIRTKSSETTVGGRSQTRIGVSRQVAAGSAPVKPGTPTSAMHFSSSEAGGLGLEI